jgi:hypothetical protein
LILFALSNHIAHYFQSVCRGILHRYEVYLTGVGTRNGPALKGFLVIKKKKEKKKGLLYECLFLPIVTI